MTEATMSESHYARDPRVPPARVGHLGKHHRVSTGVAAVAAAPLVARRDDDVGPASDAGPTYADFLEDDTAFRDAGSVGAVGEVG